MVNLTISTEDGRVASIAVAANETIENVKALVEVDLGVLLLQQQLYHNGRLLGNEMTLNTAGIKDGDLLLVRVLAAPASAPAAAPAAGGTGAPAVAGTPAPGPATATGTNAAAPAAAAAGAGAVSLLPPGALDALNFLPRAPLVPQMRPDEPVPTGLTWADVPNNILPDRLHAIVRANPPMMRQLERNNPQMAEACKNPNPAALREYMMTRAVKGFERERKAAEEIQRLNDNPFDPEAQAKIAEAIRQENVNQNYQLAMEHVPEAFSRVVMLYVDCEVNHTPLKAFVDSGAQNTIMSIKCAERCGIMRLVDRRFAGQAVGVGTARIVGKVHLAQLKIGGVFLNCSFTVLDQNDMDFLFGLDMLKRHQCLIDLKDNKLQLEGPSGPVRVPFLSEAQVRGHTDSRFLPTNPANPPQPPQPSPTGPGAGAGSSSTSGAGGSGAASSSGVAPPPVPPAASAAPPPTASAPSPAPAPAPAAAGDLFASLPANLFDPAALSAMSSNDGGGAGAGSQDEPMAAAGEGAGASSAPAPAPAAAATAQSPAAPAAANPVVEAQIGRLMGLSGCTRTEAENALEMMGGNEEMAATILLQNAAAPRRW